MKKKRVAVLIEEQYQEIEVWAPYYRLKEEGHQAVLVGQEKGKIYKGKFGYPAQVEADYAQVSASNLDGIIIPGGFAPDFMRRYPEPAHLTAEMFKAGKMTAAICHGAWILCSADVIRGRRATCFYAIADDIKNAGAEYVDAEVAVDGNLITSRRPEDIPAFCAAIIKFLH